MNRQMANLGRGENHGVFRVCALLAVVAALVFSPILVAIAQMPAALDEAGVQAHVQVHDLAANALSLHEAADHEHQFLAAHLPTRQRVERPLAALAGHVGIRMTGLARDGPRRPPRRL